jgi:cysteine desulfurase/selenocysteine lyase
MIASVSFAKTTFAGLPLKFEAGTANYIGAHGLAVAINYVQKINRAAAHAYEQQLTAYAIQQLAAIKGLRLYGTATPKTRVLSFAIDGVHAADAAAILDKLGIAVRTGRLCADTLMQRFNLQGMIRASLAFYNTKEEIDTLANGLQQVQKMIS